MAWLSRGNVKATKELVKAAIQDEKALERASLALSMYTDLPDGEVAIEEFERVAIDRLHVLKGIDTARAKGFTTSQVHEQARELAKQHLGSTNKEEAARKDAISHYVLRLAYCRTDELRRWFLTQESELFKARFDVLTGKEQRAFMAANSLPFNQLEESEFDEDLKNMLHQTVLAASGAQGQAKAIELATAAKSSHTNFYKVPFELVPDLVATRRVFLRAGYAYVPRDQVASLVVQPFRAALSKALAVTARRWAAVVAPEETDRLTPIVEGLSRRYLGPDYSDAEKRGVLGAVSAADIPSLARASFPLCMHSMYSSLHTTGDLKHEGRQQLGLFLKGIGLPLEEAVRFWRAEFATKAPGDKFDKQYLYNVRHNYGKEGKRQDYTPYSCLKIIGTTPAAGQVHGCPYKTFAPESLRAALGRLQVSPPKVEEAVSKAQAGHYQLACAAVWEGKHGCMCESGINHPNQYFEESRKALGAPVQAADVAAAAAAAGGEAAAGADGSAAGGGGSDSQQQQQGGQGQVQQLPASVLRGGDAAPLEGAPPAKMQRTG